MFFLEHRKWPGQAAAARPVSNHSGEVKTSLFLLCFRKVFLSLRTVWNRPSSGPGSAGCSSVGFALSLLPVLLQRSSTNPRQPFGARISDRLDLLLEQDLTPCSGWIGAGQDALGAAEAALPHPKALGPFPIVIFFYRSDLSVLGCSAVGNHHISSLSQPPRFSWAMPGRCCTPESLWSCLHWVSSPADICFPIPAVQS